MKRADVINEGPGSVTKYRRPIVYRSCWHALAGLVAVTLFSGWAGTAVAGEGNPPPTDKVALGENEVKELLQLMDRDKNGKISKQEFMRFMKAEFERLDRDKSGELDVRELKDSQIRSTTFLSVGK
jgi:hypothetical protein